MNTSARVIARVLGSQQSSNFSTRVPAITTAFRTISTTGTVALTSTARYSRSPKLLLPSSSRQFHKPCAKMGPLPAVQTVSKHDDKVRMLVLETDETHPETQKEIGGFGEVFNDLLVKAGDDHDPQLGIETMMQYIVEPDGGRVPGPSDIPEDLHAILITGSEWDAHGDDEWIHKLMDFIKYIWTHRPDIKFTGICFGHQILCRTLGSKVEPEPNGNWELSHTELKLSDVGKQLFRTDESSIRLHQMHLDHVVNAPSAQTTDLLEPGTQVHVWATTDHTEVQGVYIQKRLFTSQGHMEFNERYVKRQLEMRVKAGSVEQNDADEAAERADWMHDGAVVAKAVLRFFHGDDDKVH